MATDRVIFNVGGTRFETTTQTINSLPDNYFAKLIEDRWCDVSDTEIFIDRDPTHFRHFLNYLRSRIVPKCLNSKEWNELKVEAEYYDILNVVPLDGDAIEDVVAGKLAPGDLVCLTPTAVQDIGLLIGKMPHPDTGCAAHCAQNAVYDAFGFCGFCVCCGTDLHGTWDCVRSLLRRSGPGVLESLSDARSRYIAERIKFTVRMVLKGGCVLLSPVAHGFRPPRASSSVAGRHPAFSIHFLQNCIRKVGHN